MMHPIDARAVRAFTGLSQQRFGELIGLAKDAGRTIRRYESGEVEIAGPVLVLYRMIGIGHLYHKSGELRGAIIPDMEKDAQEDRTSLVAEADELAARAGFISRDSTLAGLSDAELQRALVYLRAHASAVGSWGG